MQVSLAAEDIRNEKVKVLKCMKAMSMDDVVLGQYRARTLKGQHHPGYLDDKTVPPDRCGGVGFWGLSSLVQVQRSACTRGSTTRAPWMTRPGRPTGVGVGLGQVGAWCVPPMALSSAAWQVPHLACT